MELSQSILLTVDIFLIIVLGRRPKSLEKPPVYLGDDYQFVSEDTMQLQIHEIRDTITNVDSPTLAFYIPKSVIEKLTNLVIQA